MANITLDVDEKILTAVRQHAHRCNSSIDRLVLEFLVGLAEHEYRTEQARIQLRELSTHSLGRLGKQAWVREELYAATDGPVRG